MSVNGQHVASKAAALESLHRLAEALGGAFAAHVPAAMAVLAADCHGCAPGGGLVTYRFEESIRRNAAYAHFEMCKCAAIALRAGASQASQVQPLFDKSLHTLVGALRAEQATSVAVAIAMAIKASKRAHRAPCASPNLPTG